MDEPTAPGTASDTRLRFSLLQIIAMTTAVAAAFALCYILQSPPVGSSGLFEALLPAFLLAVALWFCHSEPDVLLGTYTLVATLLGLQFFGSYLSRTDWLFGHTLGPPQLIIATCLASTIGVLTGGAWTVGKLVALQDAPAPGSSPSGQKAASVRWLGAVVVVPLTLLSGLLALASFASLPQATKRMDNYIKQRQVRADWAAAARARMSDSARESPEEYKEKFALFSGLHSKDEVVRYRAARKFIEQNKYNDQETRLYAVEILIISPHRRSGEIDQLVANGRISKGEAAEALFRAIASAPDDACRKEVIRSLRRYGPLSTSAVDRLGLLVESQSPADVRAEALQTLAAMGPAAKFAAPSIGRAWEKHLITTEQAQVLYEIYPYAAEKLQIPRPRSGP